MPSTMGMSDPSELSLKEFFKEVVPTGKKKALTDLVLEFKKKKKLKRT